MQNASPIYYLQCFDQNKGKPHLTPQLLHSRVGHVLTLAAAIAVATPRHTPALDAQNKKGHARENSHMYEPGHGTFDGGLRHARGVGPVGLQLAEGQCIQLLVPRVVQFNGTTAVQVHWGASFSV